MNQRRNAFTKIELAAVIVCIFILLGLLLPIISDQGRPLPRRTWCATQLKNLSLAAIQYENTKNQMPSWVNDFGTFGLTGELSDPSDPDVDPDALVQHRKIGTWAVSILPWLDAQPTYEMWSEDRYPVVSGGSRDRPLSTGVSGVGFCTDAAPNLSIFQCPSSNEDDIQFGRNSYIANTGMAFTPTSDPKQTRLIHTPGGESQTLSFADSLLPKYGAMNSLMDARAPGAVDVSTRVPTGLPIRLDDFTDGQGNTILFSESLSAMPWHRSGFTDQDDLVFQNDPDEVVYPKFSRFTNGLVWHSVDWEHGDKGQPIHAINGPVPGGSISATIITPTTAANFARPSSNRAEGVNAGMADGGTRYISDTVDIKIWQALLTPVGHEPIEEDSF